VRNATFSAASRPFDVAAVIALVAAAHTARGRHSRLAAVTIPQTISGNVEKMTSTMRSAKRSAAPSSIRTTI
jgi:hypothetical protein